MKAKKYLWSIICVYFCYLTHGIQAIILSQNNVNFAKQWGFNMSDPQSAAYAAGLAAVSTAVAWTGFGKFVSVWIGGEISDRVGRKKLMIGGAALYIICFLGFLFTKSALVASVCGFASGVATSGFWDASGYPAVQEAYPAAPGSALVGIKFFVSLSGMVYPLLVVHNANSGNWKLNVMIPVVMSIICLVLAIIAPFVYDDQKKASEGTDGKSKDAVQAEIDAAKAAMLTKPGKFVVFLVMFYAFLCMAIMYGAQQYTKAFGLSVCGLSEMQAAGMTSIYTIGSICAVLFWALDGVAISASCSISSPGSFSCGISSAAGMLPFSSSYWQFSSFVIQPLSSLHSWVHAVGWASSVSDGVAVFSDTLSSKTG